MEAWRFGFVDEPPAHKFDPTDEDIVAHYLLPRAVGVRGGPHEHAVIDDDPCSCPPWELLRRHGHGDSDQAFFFCPARRGDARVPRVVRAPGGGGAARGVWRGQKGVDKALVAVPAGGGGGAAGCTVRFRRYTLTYYRDGEQSSSGWVMHEYHVVHPVLHPGGVLARIKITKGAKNMRKKRMQKLRQEAAAAAARAAPAAAAVAPGPDQPGPSNYFDLQDAGSTGVAAEDTVP